MSELLTLEMASSRLPGIPTDAVKAVARMIGVGKRRANGIRFTQEDVERIAEWVSAETCLTFEVLKEPPHRSQVYFITDGEAVKIGRAEYVKQRLGELQISTYRELSVLHTEPGHSKEERALHQKFSKYRIRGEWFKLEGNLLEFLREKGCDV